jgi:phosphoribosylanthranilate isomerase
LAHRRVTQIKVCGVTRPEEALHVRFSDSEERTVMYELGTHRFILHSFVSFQMHVAPG